MKDFMKDSASLDYNHEEIKAAWTNFIEGANIKTFPRQVILDSWQRCKKMKVDPWAKTIGKVLDKPKLERIKANNNFFLNVSKPTLENLFHFVRGSGFVVALSDKDSCLLEVFGDEHVRESVQKGNWVPGAVWSESNAGTNIVSTSLYIDKPIAIVGYEHYCRCSHKHQGACAPIHDSRGEIIGTISLVGPIDKVHSHTLGMIVAAANDIEIQLKMKKAWQACDLANQHKDAIANTIYEGLMATDSNNVITTANRRIQELLKVSADKLIGVHINQLFSESFLNRLLGERWQVIDAQDEINVGGNRIECTVTCQRIVTNNRFNGLVIVISEIAHAKKLVNKLTPNNRFTFEDIIGKSLKFHNSLYFAKAVAQKECNVLLLGESGTGKDVFAQAIHNASNRRRGPFVAINCGAIPKDLIGSELFGYSEGAFTGAKKGGKMGKFELADGGTLFLDEIGEMPLDQQKVLLRVLEERNITRLGGHDLIPINVRIIAATNNDLEQEVKKGRFRHDLFYRLNVFSIKMVPLRERKDDIKLLAKAFIDRFSGGMNSSELEIPPEVWNLLYNYDWPGNIRELQNAIERALVLSEPQNKLSCDLFDFYSDNEPKINDQQELNNIKSNLQDYETDMLHKLLQQNKWNISRTSSHLGVSRTTLYRKMRLYDIKIPAEYRNTF